MQPKEQCRITCLRRQSRMCANSYYVKGANSFKILHAAEKGKEKIAFGAMLDMQTKSGLLAANLSAGITGLSKWVAGNCVALTTAACAQKIISHV